MESSYYWLHHFFITLILNVIKTLSSGIFVFFWVFYVFIAALEAYGVIDPGF